MYDPIVITKIGFFLKIITTILFFLFAYFSLSNDLAIGMYCLIGEAFVDGLANSLLSGAYQASYITKFKSKNLQTSNFFVNSLKYSIPYRLILPGLSIFILLLLDFSRSNQLLYLIIYVLVLRFIVISRINYDLKGVIKVKVFSEYKSYFSSVFHNASSCKNLVVLGAFYSFLSSIAASYFLPSLQYLFENVTLKESLLRGSLLGFFFYFKITLLGWAVVRYPFLKKIFTSHRIILALLIFSHAVLIVFDGIYIQYWAIFAVFFHAYLGLRMVHDGISKTADSSTEAGVISISESLAMAGFCIIAGIGFILDKTTIPNFINLTLLVTGAILFLWQLKKNHC